LIFAGATPCGCPFHRRVSTGAYPFYRRVSTGAYPYIPIFPQKSLKNLSFKPKAKFSRSKRFGKSLSDGSVRIGKSEPTGGIWQSGGSVLDILKFFEKNLASYLSKT